MELGEIWGVVRSRAYWAAAVKVGWQGALAGTGLFGPIVVLATGIDKVFTLGIIDWLEKLGGAGYLALVSTFWAIGMMLVAARRALPQDSPIEELQRTTIPVGDSFEITGYQILGLYGDALTNEIEIGEWISK